MMKILHLRKVKKLIANKPSIIDGEYIKIEVVLVEFRATNHEVPTAQLISEITRK